MTNLIITILLSFGLSASPLNTDILLTTEPPTDQNDNEDPNEDDTEIVIIDILEG